MYACKCMHKFRHAIRLGYQFILLDLRRFERTFDLLASGCTRHPNSNPSLHKGKATCLLSILFHFPMPNHNMKLKITDMYITPGWTIAFTVVTCSSVVWQAGIQSAGVSVPETPWFESWSQLIFWRCKTKYRFQWWNQNTIIIIIFPNYFRYKNNIQLEVVKGYFDKINIWINRSQDSILILVKNM